MNLASRGRGSDSVQRTPHTGHYKVSEARNIHFISLYGFYSAKVHYSLDYGKSWVERVLLKENNIFLYVSCLNISVLTEMIYAAFII